MARTNFSSALQSTNEIGITVTGRTSGRSLSYPVWFALEGEKLYLIPVKGSDTDWYKNLRKTPQQSAEEVCPWSLDLLPTLCVHML